MASKRKRPVERVEIKVVVHPSGRAIRQPMRRGLSILRDPEPRDAIGFHHILPDADG